MIVTTDDASDRSSRPTCRSSPSTSGARRRTRRSATPSSTPRSSAPVRTRPSSGRPASSSASCATRTTGARRRFQDEVDHQHLQEPPTRWSRPSRPASSTTPAARTPSSSTSSRPDRTSRPWRARANGWIAARLQRLRRRHRQDHQGWRSLDQGPARPGFRDALGYAVDQQRLVDHVLGGYGDVGTTNVPPVLTASGTSTDDPAHVRHRARQAEARRGGLPPRRERQRLDKEGKPISLRMFMPELRPNYPKAAQFIADWYGQLGIKVTTQVRECRRPQRTASCRPRPATRYKADYDIDLWGGAAASDPNGSVQVFNAMRSAARPTASTAIPGTTSCTRTS